MKTKNNISRSNKKKGMSIREVAESMTPDRIEYRKKKKYMQPTLNQLEWIQPKTNSQYGS